MATKARHRTLWRRGGRGGNTAYCQLMVAVIARCMSSIVLMIVARWLHVPLPGGE